MIFNFAIDTVVQCTLRQNFIIDVDTVEEAQAQAILLFEQSQHGPLGVEVTEEIYGSFISEESIDGSLTSELIYQAENGGQVLKNNAKGQD